MRWPAFVFILVASGPAAAKIPPLPEHVEVSIDARSAKALHRRALRSWHKSFDAKALREVTERLLAKPDSGLAADVVTRLKLVRKDGAILRAAYQSLDEAHAPPEALDHFVAVFGKLNDAIENKAGDEIEEQAKRLGEQLGEEQLARLKGALETFRPTSKASFDEYVSASLSEVEHAVEHEALPAAKFHDVRKSLKNVLAVVHLLEDSPAETKHSHATYEHLFALNDELGLLHDDLVRRDLHGKADYEEATIAVPEALRESISELRARFRNIARGK